MDLFPMINRILPLIRHVTPLVPIETCLRRACGGSHLENTPTTFHSYVMCAGNLDGALEKACNTIKHVLVALRKSLKGCLESFATDPLLTSIATLLDSKSSVYTGFDNYHKIAVSTPAKILAYMVHMGKYQKACIRCHTFYLVIFPTVFPKLVLI